MRDSSVLQRFLDRNSIQAANPLPLVHTADSYIIRKAVQSGTLMCNPCDVFDGENLLYFFVGRAAYKKTLREEPEYWELPSCLVFDFDVAGANRIFPFDTGAFARKRYPNYISMMHMDDYRLEASSHCVERAIGAFFQNSRDYYKLLPRDSHEFNSAHNVAVDDEEITALHRLITEKRNRFDDRRFSIEVQFNQEFDISNRRLLLAIVPEVYLGSKRYVSAIRRLGGKLETYPAYPLNKEYHYYAIYEKLDAFYRSENHYGV